MLALGNPPGPIAGMPALSLDGVSKAYGASLALNDLSIDLMPGRIHALLGQNGAGKSTAVKIMTGAERPDSGRILLAGGPVRLPSPSAAQRMGIITVHQELQTFPELTVTENIFVGRMSDRRKWHGIDWKGRQAAAREALAAFDVDIDATATMGRLDTSLQQIVEIVRAMVGKPHVLALDEPTARLSRTEAERLFAILRDLRSRDVAILFIAHDLAQVFDIADELTVLRDGRKIASRATKETNREEVIGWMVGAYSGEGRHVTRAAAAGEALLVAEGLTTPKIDRPASLTLGKGEILGLAGLLGSGVEELARQLAGVSPLRSGSLALGGKRVRFASPAAAIGAGVVYMPADRKHLGLFFNMTVAENLVASVLDKCLSGGLISERAISGRAEEAVRVLGVRPADPSRSVASLSGGNQQKVLFGRILQAKPRVIVLENPTVGVDVAAQAEIHAAIRRVAESGVGVVIASTDFGELATVCDRILTVRAGRIAGELTGAAISADAVLSSVTADVP
jgi:ABC-type sugar transport system ATPase subunit